MKLVLTCVAASLALQLQAQLCDGIVVKPEVVSGGCNGAEAFFAAGNSFSGKFWRGPGGLAFCTGGSGMTFMVDGQCTGEAISCSRRKPSRAGDARAAPVKHKELSLKETTTFAATQRARMQAGRGTPPSATLTNLVLMLKFNDTDVRSLPTKEQFDRLFNSENGTDPVIVPSRSIKTFYKELSSSRLTINSVLTGWIEVPFSKADVAGPCKPLTEPNPKDVDGLECSNGGPLVQEAIFAALSKLDSQQPASFFKQFDANGDQVVDMFTVIQSGNGAESTGGDGVLAHDIWSHKFYLAARGGWAEAEAKCGSLDDIVTDEQFDAFVLCSAITLPKSGLRFNNYNINPALWFEGNRTYVKPGVRIMHLGVASHEMGHFLGLPDYYDTDYSSDGLGVYCLMANSWGVDGTQNHAPQMSAPAKETLGWLDVMELRDLLPVGAVSFKKTFELRAVQTSHKAYKLTPNASDPTEFFIIENRRPLLSDDLLLGGVLIYHVDYKASGNSAEFLFNASSDAWRDPANHPEVRIVQPDGFYDLETYTADPRVQGQPNYDQDTGDFWPYVDPKTGKAASLSDANGLGGILNINSYARLGQRSGFSLSNFSGKGDVVTFDFEYTDPAAPTAKPTTAAPTANPTTGAPTTAKPTADSTTAAPTMAAPTTAAPTTGAPTTAAPITSKPTPASGSSNVGVLVAGVVGGLAVVGGMLWCVCKRRSVEEPATAVGTFTKNPRLAPEEQL
jgi:M6 family metalloprotease-like protein